MAAMASGQTHDGGSRFSAVGWPSPPNSGSVPATRPGRGTHSDGTICRSSERRPNDTGHCTESDAGPARARRGRADGDLVAVEQELPFLALDQDRFLATPGQLDEGSPLLLPGPSTNSCASSSDSWQREMAPSPTSSDTCTTQRQMRTKSTWTSTTISSVRSWGPSLSMRYSMLQAAESISG